MLGITRRTEFTIDLIEQGIERAAAVIQLSQRS
jgi:hypothetical protein